MWLRSSLSLEQCSLQWPPSLPKRVVSRLLLEPTGHPFLDFILRNHPAFACCVQTFLNLLADVDVILDVLQRCVLRQLLEELANLFFGRFHASQPPRGYIIPRSARSRDTFSAPLQPSGQGWRVRCARRSRGRTKGVRNVAARGALPRWPLSRNPRGRRRRRRHCTAIS